MLFRSQPRVRLSEASERLGVALSTAHRLMAMLAYRGFVLHDPDTRGYVAGPALVEIGLAAVRNREESEEGVASVGVAVPGPRNVPVAALVVSAPVSRMTAENARTIGARLRDEADRLAALLRAP